MAATAPGVCVLDCAGCSNSHGEAVPTIGSAQYDAPTVVALVAPGSFEAASTGSGCGTQSHSVRAPDPPPRQPTA